MGKEQTFVNLLKDSGFKAVYADRKNKPLLISLLNLVLPDDVHVHDIVEYRDREQEVDSAFFNRCVYYAAGHYHGELLEGKYYDTLHPVYVVAFLKTCFPHEDESQWDADHLISEYRFIEKRTKEFAPPTIFITLVHFVAIYSFHSTKAKFGGLDTGFYW